MDVAQNPWYNSVKNEKVVTGAQVVCTSCADFLSYQHDTSKSPGRAATPGKQS